MSGNVIKVDGDYKVVAKGGNITLDTTSNNGNVNIIGNLLVSGTTNILPGDGSPGMSVTVNTFTGEINGTTLTVTDCPDDGLIALQQYINGVGVANDTFAVKQLSGTTGGNGTYEVSISQHVGPIDMTVSALFLSGSIKLAEGRAIYIQDEHDYNEYAFLIGVKEEEATVYIGSENTNGLSLPNNQEYKFDSALTIGMYIAVAKVDDNDNVILGSNDSGTTQILASDNVHIPSRIQVNGTVPNHNYGAAGDKAGMFAFDNLYVYYCFADYVNNSTVIWKRTAHGSTTW
jgi:hypothetical protein